MFIKLFFSNLWGKFLMLISGWGNYLKLEAKVIKAKSVKDIKENLNSKLIARGMGRSYGDSANAKLIIETDKISRIINFNDESGIIRLRLVPLLKVF